MKRFSFLAALFGLGGAAKAQRSSLTPHWRDYPEMRPRNNECPVCGTLAPAFKPTVKNHFGSGVCLMPTSEDGTTALTICRAPTEADLPKKRQAECAHCNAVFVQRAE
jgi:hypothetical protein